MVIADSVFERERQPSIPESDNTERATVAVLDWQAWGGFLLTHVLGPAAVQIPTDPFRGFPEDEFDRVCRLFETVCFQINLSLRRRLPLGCVQLARRFAERGLYVVNGSVQDIRKSTLHRHLESIGLPSAKAAPHGAADEILFVKTNLNYGGELERGLTQENIGNAGLDDLVSSEFGAYSYRTSERGQLEPSMWTNPAIVLEKYIDNDEDSFYRAYFSGQQIVIVKAFAVGLVKKLSGDPRDTNFASELEFFRAGTDRLPLNATLKLMVAHFVEQTPVEFGCIDIVHDGHDNYYIIDLNLTPSSGADPVDPQLAAFLRLGITDPNQRKLGVWHNSPLSNL